MDTSFAIPWIFRDEINPLSDKAWKALVSKTATAHVPALWAMELVNVVIRGPRDKTTPKPSDADVAAFFALVRKMPLRVHHQGLELFMDEASPLMAKYGLTCYDAAYLLLGKRTRLPLATNDGRMRAAAIAEGLGAWK